MITLNEDQSKTILAILETQKDDFSSLLQLANLEVKKVTGISHSIDEDRVLDLRGADLIEINANSIEWSLTDLTGANLNRADLSGANLNQADLSGTNLSEANLSDANLEGANLSEANLSDANLKGANLRKVRNLHRNQINVAKGYKVGIDVLIGDKHSISYPRTLEAVIEEEAGVAGAQLAKKRPQETHEYTVNVIMHIEDTLSESSRRILQAAIEEETGVVMAEFVPSRQHLMLVSYNRSKISSKEILERIRSQRVKAKLVGPI